MDLGDDIEPDGGGQYRGERKRSGGFCGGENDEEKKEKKERKEPPEVDCTVTVGLDAIVVAVVFVVERGDDDKKDVKIKFGHSKPLVQRIVNSF